MANERRGNRFLTFLQNSIVPIGLVAIVFSIFFPLPQVLVDIGMASNMAFAVIILLIVVSTPRASEFGTFPRVLLIQTFFGLALNISSTRLILSGKVVHGQLTGQSFMVQAFAKIVTGDNLVVGFVIFIVLILMQLMVVTKGSTRISEVSARFSLDAMNPKLFDVDNRVNNGAITPEEGEELKAAIRREIDFYSAMDGSSKFVSGNAKLGIVITVINLLGGYIMGRFFNNNSAPASFAQYASLTIGDGLTSQIPSIIISFATGILVTGTKSDEPLGEQLERNFSVDGNVYQITGTLLIASGIVFAILKSPAIVILAPIGALLIWCGAQIKKKKIQEEKRIQEEAEKARAPAPKSSANSGPALLDSLSLELGYGLIDLVDKEKGAELIDRIDRIRTEMRYDMGFEIQPIHIQDNVILKPDQYSFKIDGIEAGSACVRYGYLLCMDTGTVINPLEGEKTKDPAFGMDAIWLPEEQRAEAEAAGYVVVDVPTVISTHLTEIIRSHAAQMIDTEAVSVIIEKVREKNKVLVDEVLNTAKIPYRTILTVMQNLLAEKVSIRNYKKILETMANYSGGRNVWQLTEKVREALGLQICMQYVDSSERKLRVLRLSQELTEMIAEHAIYPEDGSKPMVALDPVQRRQWITAVSTALAKASQMGYYPIILCVSQVRQLVRSSLEREQPGVAVLSDMEVMVAGSDVSVEIIDEITVEHVQPMVE